MADNYKVTIDADYFVELYKDAVSRDEAVCTINALANQSNKERAELKAKIERAEKERDELKAKLEQWQFQGKCNELIAANSTNSEQADRLRDALNENEELKAKLAEHAELLQRMEAERVELKAKLSTSQNNETVIAAEECATYKRLVAAERCIEDVKNDLKQSLSLDDEHSPTAKSALAIISAYREKKETK